MILYDLANSSLNFLSSKLIYLVTCNFCLFHNVGRTIQDLNKMIDGHLLEKSIGALLRPVIITEEILQMCFYLRGNKHLP